MGVGAPYLDPPERPSTPCDRREWPCDLAASGASSMPMRLWSIGRGKSAPGRVQPLRTPVQRSRQPQVNGVDAVWILDRAEPSRGPEILFWTLPIESGPPNPEIRTPKTQKPDPGPPPKPTVISPYQALRIFDFLDLFWTPRTIFPGSQKF